MRYPWQDETRAFESPEHPAPDFQYKRLEGVHVSIVVPPVRREVPLYMRLDPDRWALTVCVLACVCEESPGPTVWVQFLETERLFAEDYLGVELDIGDRCA